MLWQTFIRERVSSKMVCAFKSMYNSVKTCVHYISSHCEYFDSGIGLKQGDPCSPIIFMMFVNDIGSHINDNIPDIFTINEMKLFLLLYADDLVIFAKSLKS